MSWSISIYTAPLVPAHPPLPRQCLLMSRLVHEKFVVTYVESGKAKNHQVRECVGQVQEESA